MTYFQVQDLAGVIFSDHTTWKEAQEVKDELSTAYQRPFKVVPKKVEA
jgi:hypothetical protein